ncbi:heterokaryon incompatibility protein-domain-containing protein [Zalerion maritima]|uniref:Heterokaryon incompatibility protein-domain-containing protein n=1 Tax=Zalerion maritima TaxID=339359 RepID=A0AAD5RP28_9PEZI|nr:heterokaryon incompatibility protein-domain-containing protein [Zalerion maritima]
MSSTIPLSTSRHLLSRELPGQYPRVPDALMAFFQSTYIGGDATKLKYDALDSHVEETRVFRILPGGSPERLTLELRTFTLGAEDCPRFIALSTSSIINSDAEMEYRPYFPGRLRKRAEDDQIQLVEKWEPNISLGQWLGDQRPDDIDFQKLKPVQWFWMDSICINQSDVPEPNHQASFMADIYRRAAHVYAHLGQEGKDLDERTINCDLDGVFSIIKGYHYFSRMWVVQELVLAISSNILDHGEETMCRREGPRLRAAGDSFAAGGSEYKIIEIWVAAVLGIVLGEEQRACIADRIKELKGQESQGVTKELKEENSS